ncbi:hypothetical protein AVEN_231193-1 [Araneus ventricosus]|uniref:Uncharacterized protein n=1 Tax=Araneus ventricosus TaxID=182803 RepID=A0A4Y2GZI8_ARAVE|nr:hypothetical protein AVEN_231193-1 [Araneus ventricosus]
MIQTQSREELRVGEYCTNQLNIKIIGEFSDSDYTGDISARKSASGMIFKFSGGAITRASNRKKCISLSTTEAEFVAAIQA